MIVSELFDTMMNSNSDDEEPKMSRLLRLAQKFNCFYLNGKCCCADPVEPAAFLLVAMPPVCPESIA